MPNHVTNRVTAPPEVLRALLNEYGEIDFNQIAPFKGEFPWGWIDCEAEDAAEACTKAPLSDNPLLAALMAKSRECVDILAMPDECFEQFVQMLRNKRACGFFHTMDHAREAWGTKWNAYSQTVDLEAGLLKFDTAWSCPLPLLRRLSGMHPDAEIVVQFADEDIGSNCGTITLKGGEIAAQDVAGRWAAMSQIEQEHWSAFAYEVTGREPSDDEE